MRSKVATRIINNTSKSIKVMTDKTVDKLIEIRNKINANNELKNAEISWALNDLDSLIHAEKQVKNNDSLDSVVGRSEQLIADLNTIEACYDVEFGDIEKAAEYIIATGD